MSKMIKKIRTCTKHCKQMYTTFYNLP